MCSIFRKTSIKNTSIYVEYFLLNFVFDDGFLDKQVYCDLNNINVKVHIY